MIITFAEVVMKEGADHGRKTARPGLGKILASELYNNRSSILFPDGAQKIQKWVRLRPIGPFELLPTMAVITITTNDPDWLKHADCKVESLVNMITGKFPELKNELLISVITASYFLA